MLFRSDIPSFPGAEGGGMYSFGGRGGKVITVTNLNDRGPGSFREACETGGARIIVFNVAGIIRLESPIIVRAPYVTIAGQTAPGDGVCIAGESFWVDTHDVVVRHMRFRRGETKVWHRDDSFGGNPVGNIMIDHYPVETGKFQIFVFSFFKTGHELVYIPLGCFNLVRLLIKIKRISIDASPVFLFR